VPLRSHQRSSPEIAHPDLGRGASEATDRPAQAQRYDREN
jgi:hypothetical protein